MTFQYTRVEHRYRHTTPGIPRIMHGACTRQLDAFVHHRGHRHIERDCLDVSVTLQRQNIAPFDFCHDDGHYFKCLRFGQTPTLPTHKGILLRFDVVTALGAL